jgi:release factor glutamine methyltransferase
MIYPKKIYFGDHVFEVYEQVYEPAEDTFLIADKLDVKNSDVVLDVGTGCGLLAVLAAEKAKKVVAIDINPYAIKCAYRNAQTNKVKKKIDFRQGNLFEPIKENELFSLIIFNSPYLPSEPNEDSWIERAWDGGPNGRQVIDQFITEVPNFLLVGGRILLVQSSLSDLTRTFEMFNEIGLDAAVIEEVKIPFETIILVEGKI